MRLLYIFALVPLFLASCAGETIRPQLPTGASIPLVTFVFDDGDDTDFLVGIEDFFGTGGGRLLCNYNRSDQYAGPYDSCTDKCAPGGGVGDHGPYGVPSEPESLTPVEVEDELLRSKSVLEGMGLTINNMVYPFNKNNKVVRGIAAKYYRSGRGGTNSFNMGTIDPYFLKSFIIKHDLPLMKRHIDLAYADKSWLIFYQHEIDAKVKLSEEHGVFHQGRNFDASPLPELWPGYTISHWFPFYGSYMYLVPFSGLPQPGDTITGASSGATARIDYMMYDELTQLTEMIGYIHKSYPDMRIVTIDQGLDLLGIPKQPPVAKLTVEKDGIFSRWTP